ncbi:hypothetical protein [Wenzhouxiangella sediminis]|uniref:Nucleotide modification associated domain-containing protein n=1 Tax=Wenzhouxiangella sediminis TaxID=1792836 RepID=A0A3E1KAK3_9GAMM|nr:hypothetical protein [Wenzhouxiangella sediminis]RFF31380.1 hypothetical protein DZC52_04785 [Wenzhouxiangella sediminis]
MRIILSRKGFDSSAGGVPSPILPDGRMVSLPIPDSRSPLRYGDIGGEGRDIGALVSNLTRGRIRRSSRAHLDPDLVAGDLERPAGWRPVFGQEGAAQGHLRNEGVGPGDLFVFFGLFQRVTRTRGRYVFDAQAPRIHVIWGWLRVESVVPVADCPEAIRRWAGRHPHFHHDRVPGNVLYVGRRRLALSEGASRELPGSGVFSRHSRLLQLSDPAARRPSDWRLPTWMYPQAGRKALSYHRQWARWSRDGGVTRLRSAARGQEFVFPAGQYPLSAAWMEALIGRLGSDRNS